jgi:hypothetical protein
MEQPSLARNADQGSCRVEEHHEQEREHHGDEPKLEGAEEIQLKKGGR